MQFLSEHDTLDENRLPQADWNITTIDADNDNGLMVPVTRPQQIVKSRRNYSLIDVARTERFIEEEVLNDIRDQQGREDINLLQISVRN